jgi:type IV secretory pathway TraG/TraD family ATPase VirD4
VILPSWLSWSKREKDKEKSRKTFLRPLDHPYLYLNSHDYLTGWNLLENIMVFGGVGSGKSTATIYQVLMSMLQAGFGGVVMTVKENEASRIGWMCKQAGRAKDFELFDASGRHTYNFLADEAKHDGMTENLVNLLERTGEILQRASGSGPARQDEAFWQRKSKQTRRNSIDFIRIATGEVTIPAMMELLLALPTSVEQTRQENWQHSTVAQMVSLGRQNAKDDRERHDFECAVDFFTKEWPATAEKTRSIVFAIESGVLDPLCRSIPNHLFNGETTITPDQVLDERKILVIDLPIKKYLDIGAVVQTIIKQQFQKAVERRGDGHPCFLVMDEYQELCSPYDQRFLATSRGSKCCVLMATQNISNLYTVLGAEESGRAMADSIMALAQTKVFHSNPDFVTNEWASQLIGLRKKRLFNTNCNFNSPPFERSVPNYSAGSSQQYLPAVQPAEFSTLLKGGAINQGVCEAIYYQGGRRWSNGETYIRAAMKQGY